MSDTVQVITRNENGMEQLRFHKRRKVCGGFQKERFAGYSYRTHYRCHRCDVWINKSNSLNSVIKNENGILYHTCGFRIRNHSRQRKEHVYID